LAELAARPGIQRSDGAWLRRELRGRALTAGRGIVLLFAALALLMYVRWLPRWLQVQVAGASSAARLGGGHFPYQTVIYGVAAVAILSSVAWMILAGLVFYRRSHDLYGLFLSASFFSFGIMFTDIDVMMPMSRSDPWAPWPAVIIALANALTTPWVYTFPDGRFVPRWSIIPAFVWFAWSTARGIVGPAIDQATLGAWAVALNYALVLAAVGSVAYRYWRRADVVQRQQIKWALLGGVVFIAAYLPVIPVRSLLPQVSLSAGAFVFRSLTSAFLSLAVIAIPLAIGIAIFRQGLLDIDRILNRTLTYGAITVILAVGFLILTAVTNAGLQRVTGHPSELVLLGAVVPIAILFLPVRTRALRIADRFVADQTVMTLMFLDLVGSTEHAYSLGDRAWRDLLLRFRATVRRCLKRYAGKEVDTAGDGFFVTFEGPGRAVRCAREIVESVRSLDVAVRIGVHIGEVQVDGSHIAGVAVHVASRVMSAAASDEVLVSEALRDIVAGSDIELENRGIHRLKGVPEDMQLFAASA
jgi:class 3 adenylate cyclase